jgi:hypothetical protein
MKGYIREIWLKAAGLESRHVRLALMVLMLILFVIGAAAPGSGGGIEY